MDCEVVFMLQNKIAVVTGGTRGIGYAIVQKFLQNGAKVVLFGSREETVVKAVASLKEENPDWDVSGAWPKLTAAAATAKAGAARPPAAHSSRQGRKSSAIRREF